MSTPSASEGSPSIPEQLRALSKDIATQAKKGFARGVGKVEAYALTTAVTPSPCRKIASKVHLKIGPLNQSLSQKVPTEKTDIKGKVSKLRADVRASLSTRFASVQNRFKTEGEEPAEKQQASQVRRADVPKHALPPLPKREQEASASVETPVPNAPTSASPRAVPAAASVPHAPTSASPRAVPAAASVPHAPTSASPRAVPATVQVKLTPTPPRGPKSAKLAGETEAPAQTEQHLRDVLDSLDRLQVTSGNSEDQRVKNHEKFKEIYDDLLSQGKSCRTQKDRESLSEAVFDSVQIALEQGHFDAVSPELRELRESKIEEGVDPSEVNNDSEVMDLWAAERGYRREVLIEEMMGLLVPETEENRGLRAAFASLDSLEATAGKGKTKDENLVADHEEFTRLYEEFRGKPASEITQENIKKAVRESIGNGFFVGQTERSWIVKKTGGVQFGSKDGDFKEVSEEKQRLEDLASHWEFITNELTRLLTSSPERRPSVIPMPKKSVKQAGVSVTFTTQQLESLSGVLEKPQVQAIQTAFKEVLAAHADDINDALDALEGRLEQLLPKEEQSPIRKEIMMGMPRLFAHHAAQDDLEFAVKLRDLEESLHKVLRDQGVKYTPRTEVRDILYTTALLPEELTDEVISTLKLEMSEHLTSTQMQVMENYLEGMVREIRSAYDAYKSSQ